MNTTKLKELIAEDASESVRRADEYQPFIFTHPESYAAGGIYLFAAPNTPDLNRLSTELAVTLSHDAPVVLVNSCIYDPEMRIYLTQSGGNEQPIKTIPLDDASLALRYEYLCRMIEERGAKALVINCFENSAKTARHQSQLTQMFHELRNKYHIAIFVFSSLPIGRLRLCNTTRRGAHGQLTFLATRIIEAGSQLTIEEQRALPRCYELMEQHEKDVKENPPPPPAEDDPPLHVFNGKNIKQYLDVEDIDEEWYKDAGTDTNIEDSVISGVCDSEPNEEPHEKCSILNV